MEVLKIVAFAIENGLDQEKAIKLGDMVEDFGLLKWGEGYEAGHDVGHRAGMYDMEEGLFYEGDDA